MKAHSNTYKTKIKDFGRQIDSIIAYDNNGSTVELGKEQLNSVNPHYEGSILKSVMKQLDIDSNIDIPLNTIIKYYFGLYVDRYYQTEDEEYEADKDYYSYTNNKYVLLIAGTDYTVGDAITGTIYNYQDWEYLDYGNYVVYSSEKQEDTNSYRIICYDKMLYSMVNYDGDGITYPITIRNYIDAICGKMGITFKNINDTFPNYDKIIQNELYNPNDYKYRDVLDELAQVTASTICINEEEDRLELRYITDTNDTIDEEYLKDINVNFGEKFGPVNSIVLSRSAGADNVYLQDEESVEDNGLCEIKISDNQIMNWNDRDTYLPDILDTLDGLEYYKNDYTSTGITYYELCDKYNVSIDDVTYSCIMFNNELDVTQGLQELVNTPLPDETETDYSKADKTDRRINQTNLIVNKQEGYIQALTTKTEELEDAFGNVYTKTQTNELVQTAATGVTNTFSEAGGNNVLRNTRFFAKEVLDTGQQYEYWYGNVERITNDNAANGFSILLQDNLLYQTQNVANGNYTLSFAYNKTNPLATCKVIINGTEYELDGSGIFQTGISKYYQTQDTTYQQNKNYYVLNDDVYVLLVEGTDYEVGDTITGTIYNLNNIAPIQINSNQITIGFSSDIADACEIYDIMLNAGQVKLAYSQNQNETVTTTVNISKGITIDANTENVRFVAVPAGISVKNKTTDVDVVYFKDTGMETDNAKIKDSAEIVGIYRQKVGDQIWDSLV